MKDKKPSKASFRVGKAEINIETSNAWTVAVLFLSFILSVVFSAVTGSMLAEIDLVWAFSLLMGIIIINILFDMIGTATQTAQEKPFHSLAARRVSGAADSVNILRHAPQVANLCNDVIGDVAGIVSGGATATIVTQLILTFSLSGLWPSLLLTGVVSSLTIGGKAFFKTIAMKKSNNIIFFVGKIIYYVCYPFRHIKRGRK